MKFDVQSFKWTRDSESFTVTDDILRDHEDFIPELDLVAELDGQIVGNVMYTKVWLTDEAGNGKEILTFGPIAVHPDYQRKGIGKAVLEVSFQKALELD